jgi:hypothetical protein
MAIVALSVDGDTVFPSGLIKEGDSTESIDYSTVYGISVPTVFSEQSSVHIVIASEPPLCALFEGPIKDSAFDIRTRKVYMALPTLNLSRYEFTEELLIRSIPCD